MDLARLYEVEPRTLVQAVKRNIDRFPEDFMFQLTSEESESLTSQFAMSKTSGRGGRRTPPYAFTEHGVTMLSSVLNSERAIQMSIRIVRAFVKLRELFATNKDLAQRVDQLTATVKDHAALFDIVIGDIQNLDKKVTKEMRLLKAPRRTKPRIGFHTPGEK
jgi:phage regulator Rha-like protein